MPETIGIALIARNAEKTVKACVESFITHVDQCVVILAGESTDKTPEIVRSINGVEVYDFEWIDDFAAARNFSFSKLKTDWVCWVDADDTVIHPEDLREIIKDLPNEIGGIWFQYHYASDEFGNVTTLYERERLLKNTCGWIWQGRLHETVSPLNQCRYVRTDKVIILHNHLGGEPRNDRNFRLLDIMYRENPNDKRIWLYLGHQNFAACRWMKAAEWYLKFGQDNGALPLERYQALCYASKALREMHDTDQSIQVALAAIELFPNYRDAYLELAHSYLKGKQYDKAIHFAFMSDIKELIQEPPSVIFINPLSYTFDKYALLSECYVRKDDYQNALHYSKLALEIRPTDGVKQNIMYIEQRLLRERVIDGMKTLAVHLLHNQELVKLAELPKIAPWWFRETPEYEQISVMADHYTKGIKDEPEIVADGKSVMVNIAKSTNPVALLEKLDKEYDKVTVIAPYPADGVKPINIYSQSDIEKIIITKDYRHILNLRVGDERIVCEYDKKIPPGNLFRFYVGQGLEHWSPQTIKEIGCGGSETAISKVSAELAEQGHQAIVYAMDNQVWDGVLYRNFEKFMPENSHCDVFIASRVPELFNFDIQATHKWLWVHDVHCWDKLTPGVAARIDVIIALSHWHVDYLKRVYPFLKDCEVIDMDENEKTYEDHPESPQFYKDEICIRLPKIAIIGNGLDISRFKGIKAKKYPHRFIWCSSPDRGLEQVLNLWPSLKSKLPDAELKIFYGWEYFDSTLWLPSQREFKERLRLLVEQDGVEWRGRIGQDELAVEMAMSGCMLYPPPHDFRETYGIAFLEAQVSGVICFYRQNGALGETIGQRGISLPLDASQEQIVNTIVNTLNDKLLCSKLRSEGRAYALKRSWLKQANKMLNLCGKIEKAL